MIARSASGPTSTRSPRRRSRRRDRPRPTGSTRRAGRRCAQCASRSAAVRRAPVGIVRVADHDHLRARRDQALERVEVDAPASGVAILDQPPLADRAAERARQAPRLHVVRHEHHDLVARFDQVERGDEVGFGPAVGDLDVIDARAGIHRGDRPAKLDGAVGLRVDQRLVEQAFEPGGVLDQLAGRQRAHAAFRQVELHQVFVGGLHSFHRELFELHAGQFILSARHSPMMREDPIPRFVRIPARRVRDGVGRWRGRRTAVTSGAGGRVLRLGPPDHRRTVRRVHARDRARRARHPRSAAGGHPDAGIVVPRAGRRRTSGAAASRRASARGIRSRWSRTPTPPRTAAG